MPRYIGFRLKRYARRDQRRGRIEGHHAGAGAPEEQHCRPVERKPQPAGDQRAGEGERQRQTIDRKRELQRHTDEKAGDIEQRRRDAHSGGVVVAHSATAYIRIYIYDPEY
jgi:hypothetical protein